MDVRLVHSICSVYEAFGPVIFVAFRVFVAFMGHWGWTLVAFKELEVFRVVGLVVGGVCIYGIYGALALYVWHLGLV